MRSDKGSHKAYCRGKKNKHEMSGDNLYISRTGAWACRACMRENYLRNREHHILKSKKKNDSFKLETLTHYGLNGTLQCCWPECNITDIDMLSLDHIKDDGAKHRRETKNGSGHQFYCYVTREGYPEGFQTLCHNHQWKKRILGLRDAPPKFYSKRIGAPPKLYPRQRELRQVLPQ
jgi:hypothetical protein